MNEEDYADFEVEYHKEVKVDGTISEWLSTNQTTEYTQHLNSSYGGGGSYSTDKELEELKENILNWFKSHLSIPYVEFGKLEEDWYGFYVCDIKTEKINLQISDKAIEFLKRKNFPLKELFAEIENLKKNRTKFTKEYLDKIEMWKDTEKFVEDTESQIKDLVNTILDKGKTLKTVVNLEDMWTKINDLVEQLKDIDEDYSKLHSFFHSWDSHTFVCEDDEDWFWQRYNKAKEIVFGDKIDK